MTTPLVSISKLTKTFTQRKGLFGAPVAVHAVAGVSLDVQPGKTLGIVGESGCGKSTLGRMAVGLLAPSGGDVFFNGEALYDRNAHADYGAFRKSLAGVIQMVFQDPYSSLNPRMSIGESVAEPLRCSTAWRKNEGTEKNGSSSESGIRERVRAMLEQVGLGKSAATRYPHEFSGGQRQRVAIARALVTRPAFVVCDEPTSSLDASVQSQVLNLLRDLQDALGLTYLFISHDLAVVRHMSDHVAVMYRGVVVEEGDAETLFIDPLHPYTRLLLDSVPGAGKFPAADPPASDPDAPDSLTTDAADSAGEAPACARTEDAAAPAPDSGCPFASRCPDALPACFAGMPDLALLDGGRKVRCFRRSS